jgi:hypothetical protein
VDWASLWVFWASGVMDREELELVAIMTRWVTIWRFVGCFHTRLF